MKQHTITLYDYDELTDSARQKALEKWRETVDDPYMQSHMINLLKEELDERGIKYDTDSIDVRYSLSYCQGDGFMFIGDIYWHGYRVHVTHNDNHYYHLNTAQREWYALDSVDGAEVEPPRKVEMDFKTMYAEVCTLMEGKGYQHIEYTTSEEQFREECEANGYTFEEDGTMRNIPDSCDHTNTRSTHDGIECADCYEPLPELKK